MIRRTTYIAPDTGTKIEHPVRRCVLAPLGGELESGCEFCGRVYTRRDGAEYVWEYQLTSGAWVRACRPSHVRRTA